MFRLIRLVGLLGCVLSLASATMSAEAKKFPGAVATALLKGWNGLNWGASLDEFKMKFPQAAQDSKGHWSTGAGDEDLAGVKVSVAYTFNKKNQLNLLRMEPTDPADKKTLRKKLSDAGVLREGPKPNWASSGVGFYIADVDGDQFVVVVNQKFSDAAPATKPGVKPAK